MCFFPFVYRSDRHSGDGSICTCGLECAAWRVSCKVCVRRPQALVCQARHGDYMHIQAISCYCLVRSGMPVSAAKWENRSCMMLLRLAIISPLYIDWFGLLSKLDAALTCKTVDQDSKSCILHCPDYIFEGACWYCKIRGVVFFV